MTRKVEPGFPKTSCSTKTVGHQPIQSAVMKTWRPIGNASVSTAGFGMPAGGTRGDAAALAGAGYVRVNGARIDAPGRMVRTGDVITVALDRSVRVLKVRGFAERRGPAGTGESLYEDLELTVRGCSGALRAPDPCDRSKAPKRPFRVCR